MNASFLGVNLFLAACFATENLEKIEVEQNSPYQVDVYAQHTIIETQLKGGELYGFFMNSVVGVQTPEFFIHRNVCAPYTVLRWQKQLSVLTSPCKGEIWSRLIVGSRQYRLPLKDFQLVKYNYVKQELLSFSQGYLVTHRLGGTYYLGRKYVGNISDFYAFGNFVYFVRDGLTYRLSRHSLEQTHMPTSHGKLRLFYTSSASASLALVNFLLSCCHL